MVSEPRKDPIVREEAGPPRFDPKDPVTREQAPGMRRSWAAESFTFRRMERWQIGTFIAVLLVLAIIAAAWLAAGPGVTPPA
jgi:hypothetical protein